MPTAKSLIASLTESAYEVQDTGYNLEEFLRTLVSLHTVSRALKRWGGYLAAEEDPESVAFGKELLQLAEPANALAVKLLTPTGELTDKCSALYAKLKAKEKANKVVPG